MVKLALIGCGRHMCSTLIPALLGLEDYEVEVCVDRDEVAARKAQRLSHAKNWHTVIDEIDTEHVDAALVALPANVSYKIACELIKRGVACFIEKPPAFTTEEILELERLARAREVYVQIGFNFRFADALHAFYEHTQRHKATPCVATIDFRSKHPSGPEWGREDPVEAWLYHNGVHALDLALWLSGDFETVHAERLQQISEKAFALAVFVRHKNGAVSFLRMGSVTDKFDLRVELLTPDGYQYAMPHLGEVIMPLRQGKVAGEVLYRMPNLDPGTGRTGYGPELQHFLQHFRSCKESFPSLTDAHHASCLCDAIMDSLHK